jgi:hypothetical protein
LGFIAPSATTLSEHEWREFDKANRHVWGGVPAENKAHLAALAQTVLLRSYPPPWQRAIHRVDDEGKAIDDTNLLYPAPSDDYHRHQDEGHIEDGGPEEMHHLLSLPDEEQPEEEGIGQVGEREDTQPWHAPSADEQHHQDEYTEEGSGKLDTAKANDEDDETGDFLREIQEVMVTTPTPTTTTTTTTTTPRATSRVAKRKRHEDFFYV